MKQRILCLIAILCSVVSYSQGIAWVKDHSWEQVKQKAKQEDKYIFVDLYATWCGPCKMMDRDIYPLEQVGKFYNDKFLSIRVQVDKTQKDAEQIKSWYQDARRMVSDYNVNSYPTFLFFSPSGELVHRASGGYDKEKFIGLANDALNDKGYVHLIDLFKKGDFKNLNLKELAFQAKFADGDSLAKAIATVFIQRLNAEELIKQDNLTFVFQFGEQDKKWAREVCTPKMKSLSMEELANPQAIRFLIYAANNDSLATKASDYWISGMTETERFSRDTLEYIKMFVRQSTDKGFQFLYKNARKVDKVMNKKDWTVDALSGTISKEEFVVPIFNPAWKTVEDGKDKKSLKDPDWKKLNMTITNKYGPKYADWLRFSPKISWYGLTGNMKKCVTNLVLEMDRTGGWELNGFALNNNCMNVFRYSTSKKELQKAAAWMEKYYQKNPKELQTDADGLDTYAILLYKSGKVKEAIEWEEKAVKIDSKNNELVDNLAKMKKGLRIWPEGFDVAD